MIKQTLYFSNPCYLSLKRKQLVIELIKKEQESQVITRPIEDIGFVILDHPQITITHAAIQYLQDNKAIILSCNKQHLPQGLMLPIEGHSLQSKRYKYQIEASQPLKKALWQQTIQYKIINQIEVLKRLERPYRRLEVLQQRVKSGDSENAEGQAAAYYWKHYIDGFKRDPDGESPNNLLNYGYAILRTMVARSIVVTGLLPTLGIHHKNQYNAYCLADDLMEPARPFIDIIVHEIHENKKLESFLDIQDRKEVLKVMTADALFGKKKSPLMVGYGMTAASLADCFMGKKRKINYPLLI
jgi:CRISPR-associated protein Cas1